MAEILLISMNLLLQQLIIILKCGDILLNRYSMNLKIRKKKMILVISYIFSEILNILDESEINNTIFFMDNDTVHSTLDLMKYYSDYIISHIYHISIW